MARTMTAFAMGAALAFGAVTTAPGGAQASSTLSLITAWPESIGFAQDCLQLAETIETAGEGAIQMDYRGGPEAMPPRQMADALRRGVIDALCAPATYYVGTVPEADALVGTTKTPAQLRNDSDLEVLREIWADRLNAHLLAWLQSSLGFHIYTTEEPSLGPDGVPDLSGLRIRTSSTYRPILERLGATPVAMPAGEVYTGLERGVVEGMAWPGIGLIELGLDRFLKYRIEPRFLHVPTVFMINLDAWNQLSPEVQAVLERAGVNHEEVSRRSFEEQMDTEEAELLKGGLNQVRLEGEAAQKYLAIAHGAIWERLLSEAPETGPRLRERMYE